MTDCYYEDFKIGDRFVSGGMTMTEAGIIEFARQWDPQPFHTDVEFANKWTFGGLIARRYTNLYRSILAPRDSVNAWGIAGT